MEGGRVEGKVETGDGREKTLMNLEIDASASACGWQWRDERGCEREGGGEELQ